ncbi:hypothetical protein BBP40_011827 [Aspergillus hancockii]|nr:hypothetical protein BBP40_011827 [Aspergillus hancockii]
MAEGIQGERVQLWREPLVDRHNHVLPLLLELDWSRQALTLKCQFDMFQVWCPGDKGNDRGGTRLRPPFLPGTLRKIYHNNMEARQAQDINNKRGPLSHHSRRQPRANPEWDTDTSRYSDGNLGYVHEWRQEGTWETYYEPHSEALSSFKT